MSNEAPELLKAWKANRLDQLDRIIFVLEHNMRVVPDDEAGILQLAIKAAIPRLKTIEQLQAENAALRGIDKNYDTLVEGFIKLLGIKEFHSDSIVEHVQIRLEQLQVENERLRERIVYLEIGVYNRGDKQP